MRAGGELETCAVLALAALILLGYLRGEYAAAAALATGLLGAGLFVRPLARLISRGWLALVRVIGAFNNRILLVLLFLVVMVPIGLLRRRAARGLLALEPPPGTVFRAVEKEFSPEAMERPY